MEHYSELYAEYIPEHPDLESVLTSFDAYVEWDEDSTEEELSEAIDSLTNGKAPGEAVIPVERFKENKDVLFPQLNALLLQCW